MTEAARIEHAIFALLDERAPDRSICPSEVARALASDEATWRALMPRIREVAAALATAGRLRVTAGDADVDALRAHGPIRLRRPRPRG